MSRRKPTPAGATAEPAAAAPQPIPTVVAAQPGAQSTPTAEPAPAVLPQVPAVAAAPQQAEISPPIEGAAGAATDAAPQPDGDQDNEAGDADDADRVEVRVLLAFDEHQPNAIAMVRVDDLEGLKSAGQIDDDPEAVAYARSLQA